MANDKEGFTMIETIKETKKAVIKTVEDEQLEKLQKEGKIYKVITTIAPDDEDEEIDVILYFAKPKVSSFNRYIKDVSKNAIRAMDTFVLDNIVEEQREELEKMMAEYPAFSLNVGETLLRMLGLAKSTNFKKL